MEIDASNPTRQADAKPQCGKLSGVRVLDLTQFLPGPHLTMMMADHGADVIKVEAPGEGEPTRHIGPKHGATSIYFRNTQRGKRSITIDLKNPSGRDVLYKLAETADVFVEGFRPGVAQRLGIDYKALSSANRRIVYCSLSAFGQTGEWAQRPAHDLCVQALTGTLSLGTDIYGRPTMPGAPAADMAGSLMALSGILMALLRARETGSGDYLDMGMYDALLAWQPHSTLNVFSSGEAPRPDTDRAFGGAAMYNLYETRDRRWLALGGSEPKFLRNLLSALQRPDLVEYGLRPPGIEQATLRNFLRWTFLGRELSQWVEWFADKDVCFAPVLDMAEATQQSHAIDRGLVVTDEFGQLHLGNPIRFAREPAQVNFHACALGESEQEIMLELGLQGANS